MAAHGLAPARPPAPSGDETPRIEELADAGRLPRRVANLLGEFEIVTLRQALDALDAPGIESLTFDRGVGPATVELLRSLATELSLATLDAMSYSSLEDEGEQDCR